MSISLILFFFFSSRRRHTRLTCDWSSDVCSSDLRALKWLEDSRKEFLSAIAGVTERQWKWKPATDRWSISEIAEHVVLAERSEERRVGKECRSRWSR